MGWCKPRTLIDERINISADLAEENQWRVIAHYLEQITSKQPEQWLMMK